MDIKHLLEATGLEIMMKTAFGIDGNLIHPTRIASDDPIFKKAVRGAAGFSFKNYVEDFFGLLFTMQPSLAKVVFTIVTDSLDSRIPLEPINIFSSLSR